MTESHVTRDTQYAAGLRDRLQARPEIVFAYLHGSFTEGLAFVIPAKAGIQSAQTGHPLSRV